jgi:hypothetical protein
MEAFSYQGYIAFAENIIGESINAAKARTLMCRWAIDHGYRAEPNAEGTVNDLSSEARADLIIWAVASFTAGRASWESSQNRETLELFPADELYLSDTFATKRDWQTRWNIARDKLGTSTSAFAAPDTSGPFIALKNDLIWAAISRWGLPFPPFNFKCGMWVRDALDDLADQFGFFDMPCPKPVRKKHELSFLKIIPEYIDGRLEDIA